MSLRIPMILILLALAAPVQAQGKSKRYALLVGVTEYDSSNFTTLKFAENDATATAKVLKDSGYDEVIVLTTSRGKKDKKEAPTAANIRAALKTLSGKVKRDDLLLVGLSGHGVLWPVLDEKTKKERDESFFCPQDARPRSNQSLAELEKTMISIGELFRSLDESGAGVRLMLVDACRNEVKGDARSIDFDQLPTTKKGTAVLFSCKAGERAFESEKLKHGVFFHHVIEGLKGEAKDKRGLVTWSLLVDHVVEKVTEDVPVLIRDGAKQTPHEKRNIEGISPVLLPPGKAMSEADKLFREATDALLGSVGQIDNDRALKLYRQAAVKGHAVAAARAGRMIYLGQGAAKNEAEGLKLIAQALPGLREQADADNPDAQLLLGLLLASGLGATKDDKKAIEWYTKAADKGEIDGMANLGSMYSAGRGVGKDEKKAVEWYTKAADKGHPGAMNSLGVRYEKGRGVTKDEKQAVEWYTKAADKGNEVAMTNLGWMYQSGRGGTKDEKKAVDLFTRAANRGHARAMTNLGLVYANGRGVDKDERKAVEWYAKGAEKGDGRAMYYLAWRYEVGQGVTRDEKKAVEWYTKGAEKGDARAMASLGELYEKGRGVNESRAEALKWYRKAAALGNADARKAVARLEEKK